jgi:hypothetical protein
VAGKNDVTDGRATFFNFQDSCNIPDPPLHILKVVRSRPVFLPRKGQKSPKPGKILEFRGLLVDLFPELSGSDPISFGNSSRSTSYHFQKIRKFSLSSISGRNKNTAESP